MNCKSKNVCVVVLGDIGRSPRMQYHSLSLAEMGHKVDLIGYGESEPLNEVKNTPLLFHHYLMPCPQIPSKLLNYVFKTLWQSVNLLFLLVISRKPDILLVQNPPAIPSLIICWIFCRIVGSKFVIDWHNYAHSLMSMNLSQKNLLVRITKKVEAFIGRRADYNICVTNAMKNDLQNAWNISAIILYDKPPDLFRSISLREKHNFFKELGKTYENLLCENDSTLFTKMENGEVVLRASRPGILVSSTSWTEDEDFSIFFSALQDYENEIQNGNQRVLPDLHCFITGKGKLKDYYCKKILAQNWKYVFVYTPWLAPTDYPLMLASADLGICLHISSSGLDLPMKVVDMFGCGLPVCAYNFNCLEELVKHGINGFTFQSSKQLSTQLQDWFQNFPNDQLHTKIERKMKTEIEAFQNLRWQKNWTNVVSSVFK